MDKKKHDHAVRRLMQQRQNYTEEDASKIAYAIEAGTVKRGGKKKAPAKKRTK